MYRLGTRARILTTGVCALFQVALLLGFLFSLSACGDEKYARGASSEEDPSGEMNSRGTDEDPVEEQNNDVSETNNSDPSLPENNNNGSGNAEICLSYGDLEEVDFGLVPQGNTAAETITLRNCSQELPLRFEQIALEEGDEGFFVDTSDFSSTLAPGEEMKITVRFEPEDLGESRDLLVVRVEELETVQIVLRGESQGQVCPEAQIRGRIQAVHGEEADPWQEILETVPLKNIELSAENSLDPDNPGGERNGIARYLWTLIQRPSGSQAQLQRTVADNSQMRFFADTSGIYTIQLEVFDEDGIVSCEPATFRVAAIPKGDLWVEVIWEQDSSDVDLHFLKMDPEAQWNEAPWDCFWRNGSPDWGGPEGSDPELTVDSTGAPGGKFEQIQVELPEDGAVYRVGVHHFSDRGQGPAYASLRVWVQGVVTYESHSTPMESGAFWEPLEIRWNDGAEFLELNEYSSSLP